MYRFFTAALFSLAALFAPALAQEFPDRPVRLVVPFLAGGTVDSTGRILAQKLSEQTGQQFIVENRGGAGGNIGSEAVAKSNPDGYTLLHTAPTLVVNQFLYNNMPYDADKDFAPIGLFAVTPVVLMVSNDLPVKNLDELIAYAKANPGKVSFGSAGVGTIPHLAGELFKSLAKVEIVHVPYKGTSAAMNDLVGGHIQVLFDLLPSSLPQIKSGRVRAIANAGTKRPAVLADLPTLAEQGLKGYDAASWVAVVAPVKTPAPILKKLRTEMGAALKSPDIVKRLSDLGSMPGTADEADFRKFLKTETDKWAEVIKASGAKQK
ncbi:Bug family tripartite tricarboxylate transporter substrate binding protein [Pseudorhodoplanes sinuspersici]|nr:tripartite tricarboxylate transporter substrate binding protein [Pseudorhodoplanes sinuspersici]